VAGAVRGQPARDRARPERYPRRDRAGDAAHGAGTVDVARTSRSDHADPGISIGPVVGIGPAAGGGIRTGVRTGVGSGADVD
jgi:hypothetical protein